jgi:hypothetical protein
MDFKGGGWTKTDVSFLGFRREFWVHDSSSPDELVRIQTKRGKVVYQYKLVRICKWEEGRLVRTSRMREFEAFLRGRGYRCLAF